MGVQGYSSIGRCYIIMHARVEQEGVGTRQTHCAAVAGQRRGLLLMTHLVGACSTA